MTTPRIYTDLSADERATAHAAYRRITGQCIDPGFAPDRAWVEGWIAACAERSADEEKQRLLFLDELNPTTDGGAS